MAHLLLGGDTLWHRGGSEAVLERCQHAEELNPDFFQARDFRAHAIRNLERCVLVRF